MLNENIRALRKAKGLSQEELALKLNVVRQTISKWEQGLSVPDADMLIMLSHVFETPVSTLLGETIPEQEASDLQAIAEKLEVINLQLAQREAHKRKVWHTLFVVLLVLVVAIFVGLAVAQSPYLSWDFSDPETAVIGTGFHVFEWTFMRVLPLLVVGLLLGIFFTRKKR